MAGEQLIKFKELLANREVSLDQQYRQEADEGDLALIRQQALKKDLTKDDIYVRAMYLCNDLVDYYYTRFDSGDLDAICEMIIGQSVLIGHKKEEAPLARFYKAEKVTRKDKEFLNDETGKQVEWVKAYFYWAKGTSDAEDIRAKIDTGTWKEVSISWTYTKAICSICQKDMMDMSALFAEGSSEEPCKHRLGKVYEGKLCYATIRDIKKVLEGSVVFKGGQKFTEFTYVRGHESGATDTERSTVEFLKHRTYIPENLSMEEVLSRLEACDAKSPVFYNKSVKAFVCSTDDRAEVQRHIPDAQFLDTANDLDKVVRFFDDPSVYACAAAPADKVPGRFFKPLKPHRRGAESNEYYKADRLKELTGSYLLSPKYDGIRLSIHKDTAGKIHMFTSGGKEVSRMFPAIAGQIRELSEVKSVILDGELVKVNGSKRTTHADVSEYINSVNKATDDRNFVFKAFDIVYFNGRDLSKDELKDRIGILNANIKTTANINRVANVRAEGGEAVFNLLDQISSREGAVIKTESSAYDSGRNWYKWKRQSEFTAVVIERNDVGKNVYTYKVGVLDDNGAIRELGSTFQTQVYADKDDCLRLSVCYIKKRDDGTYMMAEPSVVIRVSEYASPDSLITIERIVEAFDETRATAKKKKCPKCGMSCDQDCEECPKCKYKFNQQEDKADDKMKKCPKCGTMNPMDAKKCSKCELEFETDEACKTKKKNRYILEHHWDVDSQFRILEIEHEGNLYVIAINGGINDEVAGLQRVFFDSVSGVEESTDERKPFKSAKEKNNLPDNAFALLYSTKNGGKVRMLPHHFAAVSKGHTWTGPDVDKAHLTAAAKLIGKIKFAPEAKLKAAQTHIDKHIEMINAEKKKKARTICSGEAEVEALSSGSIRVRLSEVKRGGLPVEFTLKPVVVNGNVEAYLDAGNNK
jgi:hypothetical protein